MRPRFRRWTEHGRQGGHRTGANPDKTLDRFFCDPFSLSRETPLASFSCHLLSFKVASGRLLLRPPFYPPTPGAPRRAPSPWRAPSDHALCSERGQALERSVPAHTFSLLSGGPVCLRLRASNEHPSEACAFCEHERWTGPPRSSLRALPQLHRINIHIEFQPAGLLARLDGLQRGLHALTRRVCVR